MSGFLLLLFFFFCFFFFVFFVVFFVCVCVKTNTLIKGKRKVLGVPQSQAAAHLRHEEEDETDKTKQAQIKQTYEKH